VIAREAPGSSIVISFGLGGRRFSTEVDGSSDHIQQELWDLVNDALEAAGRAERLQTIPDEPEGFAYVSDAVFKRARERGVI
jgi:hypothetical protein